MSQSSQQDQASESMLEKYVFKRARKLRRILNGKYLSNLLELLNDECNMVSLHTVSEVSDEQKNDAKKIIATIQQSHRDLKANLADTKRFQQALLYLLPEETLQLRAPSLITEYNTLTENKGNTTLIAAVESAMKGIKKTPDDTTTPGLEKEKEIPDTASDKVPTLRNALIELVDESNRIWIARTQRVWQRAFFSLSNVSLILTVALIFLISDGTAAQVFFAGVLGGALSTQMRLFSAEIPEDRWVRGFQSVPSVLTLLISPIIGGIFALLLFAFLQSPLAASVFSPSIIPKFSLGYSGDDSYILPWSAFLNVYPSDTSNAASLLLFSFLSGFSERLIPDLLDRLSKQVVSKETEGGKK